MSDAARSSRRGNLKVFLRPASLAADLWRHRELIGQMTRREVTSMYRGSAGGIVWTLIQPLVLLAVYTFVFSVVFQAKPWRAAAEGGAEASRTEFALGLFAGLVVFNLFTEAVRRAPSCIVSQVNYVKKVVFPLQAIPVSIMAAALFLAVVNLSILLLAVLVLQGGVAVTALCAPLVLLPVILLSLGLSFFLASLGVYVRDVDHVVTIVLQILFFLTPIFYPIDALHPPFRTVIELNPLSPIVESAREVLILGAWPNWGWLLAAWVVSAACLQLGYAWFMGTKRGFADVL